MKIRAFYGILSSRMINYLSFGRKCLKKPENSHYGENGDT